MNKERAWRDVGSFVRPLSSRNNIPAWIHLVFLEFMYSKRLFYILLYILRTLSLHIIMVPCEEDGTEVRLGWQGDGDLRNPEEQPLAVAGKSFSEMLEDQMMQSSKPVSTEAKKVHPRMNVFIPNY